MANAKRGSQPNIRRTKITEVKTWINKTWIYGNIQTQWKEIHRNFDVISKMRSSSCFLRMDLEREMSKGKVEISFKIYLNKEEFPCGKELLLDVFLKSLLKLS